MARRFGTGDASRMAARRDRRRRSRAERTTAARLLARAGAAVYASDSGTRRELETDRRRRLRQDGVDVAARRPRPRRASRRASLVVASPRRSARRAAARRGARRRTSTIVSEIEIGAAIPAAAQVHRDHRHERQDDHDRADRASPRALGRRPRPRATSGRRSPSSRCWPTPPDWVALEVSSFQLHDTPSINPPRRRADEPVGRTISIGTTSVDEYYGDKALLFRNATAGSHWVTNGDDRRRAGDGRRPSPGRPLPRSRSRERARRVSRSRRASELVVLGQPLSARDELPLLGDHNVANALAASLAVMLADRDARDAARRSSAIAGALRIVQRARASDRDASAKFDGVTWINDSKSTNVASTLVALRGMTRADRSAARRQAQGRAVHGARARARAHGTRGDRLRRSRAAHRERSRGVGAA